MAAERETHRAWIWEDTSTYPQDWPSACREHTALHRAFEVQRDSYERLGRKFQDEQSERGRLEAALDSVDEVENSADLAYLRSAFPVDAEAWCSNCQRATLFYDSEDKGADEEVCEWCRSGTFLETGALRAIQRVLWGDKLFPTDGTDYTDGETGETCPQFVFRKLLDSGGFVGISKDGSVWFPGYQSQRLTPSCLHALAMSILHEWFDRDLLMNLFRCLFWDDLRADALSDKPLPAKEALAQALYEMGQDDFGQPEWRDLQDFTRDGWRRDAGNALAFLSPWLVGVDMEASDDEQG